MKMKKAGVLLILAAAVCACTPKATVTVRNPLGIDRRSEMVEIPVERLSKVKLSGDKTFVVTDSAGSVIPSQVTHDGLLIFQSGLGEGETARFTVSAGQPREFTAKTYGRYAEERFGDFIWENDRVAFRVYGEPLAAIDGPNNGIDALYKRSEEMVIDRWYADFFEKDLSYHDDHGTGLDDYKVGRSLGAGAMAPWIDSALVLNGNFRRHELLDNGPLRTTFRLFYEDLDAGGKKVAETRTISIDAGSQMSRIVQEYGFTEPVTVAAGFPLHDGATENSRHIHGKWMIVFEPPTPKTSGVFLGLVFPGGIESTAADEYTVPETEKNSGTYRHALALTTYAPGMPLTYYTGFGWEKWGGWDSRSFHGYLDGFTVALDNPFIIEIE